ncbi:RNA methyltransferase RsmF [Tatumella morbirosei]|uniref:Ribosomal RNA small subunit methyltransferase F n=1 Tax=Tatumella morbirosei TaxID=642227 RepID=A0A095VAV6_9GAMM|nr:16S rRNA (cytosine(1407)-C(5))-methyltransferase RsmF [Tatumella morbirosei]KGD71845.1 RNA methyltransferase RsmF [Tatumella morbirosei]
MSDSLFFPEDFLLQMQQLLADDQQFSRFKALCHQPLRRSIRVNTLKISVDDFLEQVSVYDWQLTPVPWCEEGFWVSRADESLPLGSVAEHLSGLFYIQEASSMLPVTALFAHSESPVYVMDMAAAPGSKTTQIAARMKNQGMILANEYSASRVKVLHANINRCGVTHSALTHFDAAVFGPALPEQFDAILLDAPCSGEGVIRKDPQALKNWSMESCRQIAATQQQLLQSAFHALKPGGTLVYSTCTLNTLENQQVVNTLLTQFADAAEVVALTELFSGAERVATPEGYLHVFPHCFDSEGFFVACLRKTASVAPLPAPTYKVGKFPFSPLTSKQTTEVRRHAAASGLHWDDGLELWSRDKEVWLFPRAATPLFGRIRFSRIGLKLAETFAKGYRWQNEAVIALADSAHASAIELTDDEAEEWFRGRDIYPPQPLPTDEMLVLHRGQPLGLAKKVGNRIKNSYPRELVRDGRLFR